jgi:putative hydrolase of the HAD superfamily
MVLNLKPNSFFVFDLDDTLYQEIDYLQSAYKHISKYIQTATNENIYDLMLELYKSKKNVFQWIVSSYNKIDSRITMDFLLQLYRQHEPDIKLNEEAKHFLQILQDKNIPAALITDGRSITQRNKLKALGISNYFKDVIISEEFGSEKPDERNYLYLEKKYAGKNFYFIGDNTAKDFTVPLKLRWFTICLKDKGGNIHNQDFSEVFPDLILNSFNELLLN